MNKNKLKRILLRILVPITILGISFIPIFFIFKHVDSDLWQAFSTGNEQLLVTEIKKYDNAWGAIIISILHVLQDVFIVIPSAPIHISAGILLGSFKGFLVCHVTDVATNLTLFAIYRKVKTKIDKLIPIEKSSKTVSMIKNGKNKTYMVILASLLPAVPNGFIPYAAVNAGISFRGYFVAMLIGPAIPTFVLTLVGGSIFEGNWILMVFLLLISFVGVYFLMKFQNQILNLFGKCKKIFCINPKLNGTEFNLSQNQENYSSCISETEKCTLKQMNEVSEQKIEEALPPDAESSSEVVEILCLKHEKSPRINS